MLDYYVILGVAPAATTAEIKAAWRTAQQRWHPDRCGEPEAEHRFKEAAEAYRVLSDPPARALHDQRSRQRANHEAGVGADIRADVDLPARLTWVGGRVLFTVTLHGRSQSVELQVPTDAQPGFLWRFAGRGAPGIPPGNLIVRLRNVDPDPLWRAEGLDLHGDLVVTLSQVYEGASVQVDGPAGPLRIPLPARELKPIRLRGHGRRSGGRVGDLVLELALVWPRPDAALAATLRRAGPEPRR